MLGTFKQQFQTMAPHCQCPPQWSDQQYTSTRLVVHWRMKVLKQFGLTHGMT